MATAATVFRDYETDGVPASGSHKVKKSDVRTWGSGLEAIINAFTANGGLIYSTLALLNGNLNYASNTMAWVIADPIAANNGVYRKTGGVGSGSWIRMADLPYSFIVASDAGAGTPNAIQATTSVPVSSSALIWMNVFEANTASPVTVSFNGGSALTIKTNSGNDVIAGGLTSGMILLGVVSGSTFRLFSDEAIASLIFEARDEAEAAKVAAEAARDIAVAAAEAAVSTNLVPIFDNRTIAASFDLSAISTVQINRSEAGDPTAPAPYAKVGSEPLHTLKFQSSDGAWWEFDNPTIDLRMLGIADGDDITSAIAAAVAFCKTRGKRKIFIPSGTYIFDGISVTDSLFDVDIEGEGGKWPTLKPTQAAVDSGTLRLLRFEPGEAFEITGFSLAAAVEALPSTLLPAWKRGCSSRYLPASFGIMTTVGFIHAVNCTSLPT